MPAYSIYTKTFQCKLDIVKRESHERKLSLTDNTVEDGSKITDHAHLEPCSVSLRGRVVAFNIQGDNALYAQNAANTANASRMIDNQGKWEAAFSSAFRDVSEDQNRLKFIVDKARTRIEHYGEETLAAVRRIDTIGDLVQGATRGQVYSSQYSGEKFSDTSRLKEFMAALDRMQASCEPINVTTPVKYYQNMLLVGYAVDTDNINVIDITLNFREVRKVSPLTVAGNNTAPGKASMMQIKGQANNSPIGKAMENAANQQKMVTHRAQSAHEKRVGSLAQRQASNDELAKRIQYHIDAMKRGKY